MALRLIEMILTGKDSEGVSELLKDQNILEHRQIHLENEETLIRILLEAEKSETVLDLIEKKYGGDKEKRVVILPVEAILPRVEEAKREGDQTSEEKKEPERIGREELYEDVRDAGNFSRVFLAMTVLSTIVAAVGLHFNNVPMIIGAMVIAPSIGPSMAVALSTTLGDLPLLWRAALTGFSGIAIATILSVIIGAFLQVDPTSTEIALRTQVGLGDIAVAFASGCAGTLAFTTAVSESLIGVMVAVSLLPPLVTFGLLIGSGHVDHAMGALLLFFVNTICINLAGVVTFLFQGVRPITWWEEGRAKKATMIAISLWVVLLGALVTLILLFK